MPLVRGLISAACRWHRIPEPSTNKYYVVLGKESFVRGIDVAIGMRSILAVRFSLEHCDTNQRTHTIWYGEVSGLVVPNSCSCPGQARSPGLISFHFRLEAPRIHRCSRP